MAGPIQQISIPFEIAVGVGVGAAVGDVVIPKLEKFRTDQWQKYPHHPLPATQAALASIKGFPTALKLAEEAAKSGYSADVFGALEQNLREHPELALALMMWRRGYIAGTDVDVYLHRHGFDKDTRDAILNPRGEPGGLKNERLAPAQIALGIVRSIIADPKLMPVTLDVTGGAVEAYPQSSIKALDEAADSGIDKERLRVMVGEIGLPMSSQQAASALFRKLLLPNGRRFAREDFNRAILEGDTRPEWADAILEQAREILSANQYAELELRGFLTPQERRLKTDQHGMSREDSNLLFDVLGRSINVHQIVTGEARGGTYKPPPDTLAQQEAGIPPAFLASLQRGNLRPEYYDLAYANRYTYPSFFAIRGLLTGGALTADQGYEILLEMGWKPSLARQVADFYGSGTAGTAVAPEVKSAHTRALTLLRNAYVARRVDDAFATDRLTALEIDATVQGPLLDAWRIMQTIPGAGLTRAQIKKAYKEDLATWTLDRAMTELEDLGMLPAEAQDYLTE